LPAAPRPWPPGWKCASSKRLKNNWAFPSRAVRFPASRPLWKPPRSPSRLSGGSDRGANAFDCDSGCQMEDLLQLCASTYRHLQALPPEAPLHSLVKTDATLRDFVDRIKQQLHACVEVYSPPGVAPKVDPARPLQAVTWNLERGKNFPSLLRTLRSHSLLRDADLYFFTEVDWGMARSDNRNVAAELGEALGRYAYFAPSYYNFTKGHGSERHLPGQNTFGLHGKALLSRSPLQNLRAVPMTNAFDKLKSKEARLGEKRALVGDLK